MVICSPGKMTPCHETVEGLFELTQDPQGPLALTCALLLEPPRYQDTVALRVTIALILNQTLDYVFVRRHFFLLLQMFGGSLLAPFTTTLV